MDSTLLDLIRDIDDRVDTAVADEHQRDELIARVQQLRDSWEEHRARWDGDDGLYHDLTTTDPRVTPMVRRLRNDSLRLLASCDGALAQLRQLDANSDPAAHDRARAAVRDVTAHVERHLSLAASATHDAFAVDLGSDA